MARRRRRSRRSRRSGRFMKNPMGMSWMTFGLLAIGGYIFYKKFVQKKAALAPAPTAAALPAPAATADYEYGGGIFGGHYGSLT